jgi:hypothetical protein
MNGTTTIVDKKRKRHMGTNWNQMGTFQGKALGTEKQGV